MSNINKTPKKMMQQIEQALEEEHKTTHKEQKPDGVDPRQKQMSEGEHVSMYESGYAAPGIVMTKIKCRLCSKEVECSSSSKMALIGVCPFCYRRKNKSSGSDGGVIEI